MRIDFNFGGNTFQARTDQRFINAMQSFINNGENRLKNNYKLHKKISDLSSCGFADYTIKMQKYETVLGSEYVLRAVNDGDVFDNGSLLAKKTSFRKITENFLKLSKGDLNRAIRKTET